MRQCINIIKDTPFGCGGILAYMLYVGGSALKTRVVSIQKLFIIPIILISLRYQIFVSKNAMLYFLGICCEIGLGWLMIARNPGRLVNHARSIELKGTYTTLAFLLLFFCLKYAYGLLSAYNPIIAMKYSYLEALFSALLAGFSLGKAIYYFVKLKKLSIKGN